MSDSPLPAARVQLNAWTGAAAAESSLPASWKRWALRVHEAHRDGKIPKLLFVQPPAPLENWRHKDVGWGLVMPDTDKYSAAEKAVAVDAPEPIRELLKSRRGSPVFRYWKELNDLYLQIYRSNGTENPVKIAGSNSEGQATTVCRATY
jgi:hypothetical protein